MKNKKCYKMMLFLFLFIFIFYYSIVAIFWEMNSDKFSGKTCVYVELRSKKIMIIIIIIIIILIIANNNCK